MTPCEGEVWFADLGIAGKARPVIVILLCDVPVERTLIPFIPITSQARGGPLEVSLGHLNFLSRDSVANIQAISSHVRSRFERRLGGLPPADYERIKQAMRTAFGL